MSENPSFFDKLTDFASNTFSTLLDFDLKKTEIESREAKTQPEPSPAYTAANQIDNTVTQDRFMGMTTRQLAIAGGAVFAGFIIAKAVK